MTGSRPWTIGLTSPVSRRLVIGASATPTGIPISPRPEVFTVSTGRPLLPKPTVVGLL